MKWVNDKSLNLKQFKLNLFKWHSTLFPLILQFSLCQGNISSFYIYFSFDLPAKHTDKKITFMLNYLAVTEGVQEHKDHNFFLTSPLQSLQQRVKSPIKEENKTAPPGINLLHLPPLQSP